MICGIRYRIALKKPRIAFPISILCLAVLVLPCSLAALDLDSGLQQDHYEWVLVDSINASVRIPSGEKCIITYMNSTGTLLFGDRF
jgi:hypothetical protein